MMTRHEQMAGQAASVTGGVTGGETEQAKTGCRRGTPRRGRVLDWVESQSRVTRVWLDQLIAEGDPDDLASLIHKQAAWLDLMQARLKQS